ncbi:tubulin delta chain [Patella vulgata]|uniref:tubulin delta chain n=1 Tax=Patella vulgata TaxID=6465 RepID=UPI0024A80B8A|nr:tubulin delta chain [Patella vulgata]
MSTVTLHVGQCGNQVGKSFLKNLIDTEEVKESLTYIDNSGKLRSVHVDSEPKVVHKLQKSLSQVREKNIICGKRGRGTNWALGYYGLKSETENNLVEDTTEALRKEIERCDSYCGVVLMHSLSGGTGSGLGSRLCEVIRDDYPMNYLLSCTFAPFSSGESPLQHYNSLLTLSALQRYSDGIILTYNDEILYRLQKQASDNIVSMENINQQTSKNLCGVFLPTDTLRPQSGLTIGSEPWELLRSTCPMPSTKFIHINHKAKSKVSWENLIGLSLQNLTKHNKQGEPFGCLSGVAIGRGDQSGLFHQALEKGFSQRIRTSYNCVKWNPFPLDTWSAKQKIVQGKENFSSITIAANYSNIVEYLSTVRYKAKLMYDNQAYLHWYWRYGATQDLFEEAFNTVDGIIEDYKAAVS